MVMKTGELLLHWRWPVTAIIALGIIAIEMIEHPLVNLRDLDFALVREILLFGVAFPLIVGLLLNALVRLRVEGIHPTPALILNHEEKGINIPRVLVVENELMLGAAVERLLASEAWLNIEGVTPSNQSSLIETIKQLKPNVIILDQASLLTIPLRVLADLLDYTGLRVVTMSACDNRIQIYDKQQQLVITQLTDLVKVIRISQSPTP